jgi:hypothetical protein
MFCHWALWGPFTPQSIMVVRLPPVSATGRWCVRTGMAGCPVLPGEPLDPHVPRAFSPCSPTKISLFLWLLLSAFLACLVNQATGGWHSSKRSRPKFKFFFWHFLPDALANHQLLPWLLHSYLWNGSDRACTGYLMGLSGVQLQLWIWKSFENSITQMITMDPRMPCLYLSHPNNTTW